eukprot:scaffold84672_cov50-Prasinocladus_malaysianus.AAC.2
MSIQNSKSGKAVPSLATTEAPPRGGGIKGWWKRVCQQRLTGWTPKHSIFTVLSYYMVATCVMLAL